MMTSCKNGPLLMGIVNVTPDSFSDGGDFLNPDDAIRHGLQLVEDGADILDIGGESTRPGAKPVAIQEEIDRVLPVIEGLRGCGKLLSIDTRHAQTMQAAIDAGAGMVNDVMALRGEGALDLVARSGVQVCLMHMQGEPQSMQKNPVYEDVIKDIHMFLHSRIVACEQAGISKDQIIIDPGIGFGKTLIHNLEILKNIQSFKDLGCRILLGASRKSFISAIDNEAETVQRLGGSLASAFRGYQQGVDILRVHDVRDTRQFLNVYQAIANEVA